jgi:glycine cleavage system transcriptional repressor
MGHFQRVATESGFLLQMECRSYYTPLFMKTESKERWVISVLIADRVGILREITSAVTDMGANIDGISQTIVANYFTVILTATFNRSVNGDAIIHAIKSRFTPDEASIVVRPCVAPAAADAQTRDRYIITMTGQDAPGMLKAVTTLLANRNINLEDWYVSFHDKQVTHIGEVSVPVLLDIKQVQDDLRHAMAPFKLSVLIQHENLFRVTNEVGAIGSLLKGKRNAPVG